MYAVESVDWYAMLLNVKVLGSTFDQFEDSLSHRGVQEPDADCSNVSGASWLNGRQTLCDLHFTHGVSHFIQGKVILPIKV